VRNTFWVALGVSLLITGFFVTHFDEQQLMDSILKSGLMTESSDISEREFQEAFMDFIQTYKKSYENSWNFEQKYQVFRDNYQYIQDHTMNEEVYGFSLRMNEFGDLSSEEFGAKYLGYKEELPQRNPTTEVRENITNVQISRLKSKDFKIFQTLLIGLLQARSKVSRTKDNVDHAGPSQLLEPLSQQKLLLTGLSQTCLNNNLLIAHTQTKDVTEVS
jgi:hypothetical protein